jgi:NADH-quinone oxidoreductase subunit K
MSIALTHYLILSAILFIIALVGVMINHRNLIVVLLSIELMLLAVNFNFISFAHFLHNYHGQIFVFFTLTVAATEAAIGLALLILLFRQRNSIAIADISSMKG